MRASFSLLLTLFLSINSFGQVQVKGTITGKEGPISGASVAIKGTEFGKITDRHGNFSFSISPSKYTFQIRHLGYLSIDTTLNVQEESNIVIQLTSDVKILDQVEISNDRTENATVKQNTISVSSKSAANLPSAFSDFSKVLVSLPGVSSNNELSSSYSVRGGNFDENLVYVNEIPVYRPFLSNSGRQEGLSFVNADMVSNISFSAGGWEAKYGDKLSSSLNISYKEPEDMEGGFELGLLGGKGYLGGSSKEEKIKYLIGVRHRDSKYLLNTLEVEGQYFPKFTDLQSMVTFDLTRPNSNFINKTKLNWLTSYARNRYLTTPSSQLTEFGSVTTNFRLQTAFTGREILNYDTYQTGFALKHWFNPKLNTSLILSGVLTREKETYEVEGGYRLCDVDNNPTSSTFENCIIVRGIGTQFDYGRNDLKAAIGQVENRFQMILDNNSVLEVGLGLRPQTISDKLDEYTFKDSADFITVTERTDNEIDLRNSHVFGFAQIHHYSRDSVQELNVGLRVNRWDQTKETLLSPRFSYRIKPNWEKVTHFNFSVGSYSQHPFYRELRSYDGNLSSEAQAQKSIQLITGVDRYLTLWSRPFLLQAQFYYKFLSSITPYEVDNLRVRYFPENVGSGFARGFDIRLNGEFIKNTQSWFSLSYLKTEENIPGDGRSLIRRPLDQRINVGAYFEDHLPTNPSVRVYLNINFGSGYPFGPPSNAELRNVFQGDEYYRADIGFSKIFQLNRTYAKVLSIKLEALNAFAADNTLSYSWIEDVNGTSFAIPNSLSARFLNLKVSTEF